MKHIILLILLMVGVWAQEVGVPYVDTKNATRHHSAVISSDGEMLYTLNNEKINYWATNPIKKIDSFFVKDGRMVWLTTDQKKIIVITDEGLCLYDLTSKALLQKISDQGIEHSAINNDVLITINKDLTLKKWSLVNLKEIKRLKLSLPISDTVIDEHRSEYFMLFGDQNTNRMLLVTGNRFIVFDTESLEILKQIDSYTTHVPKATIDQKVVYPDGHYKVNLEKIFISFTDEDVVNQNELIAYNYQLPQNSQSNRFAIVLKNKEVEIYEKQTLRKLMTLYQFIDNTWIAITPTGNFDRSDGALRYLKKKVSSKTAFETPTGKIYSKPVLDRIDTNVIQQFQKKINLKD